MITRKSQSAAICYFLSVITPSLCHMQMSWPYPLRSEFNPANNYTDIDYSMTDPLDADGSNFPCKGYQNDRPIQPVATYNAGSTYNMTLAGSTMHGGGSCQLSLSYDNGATFSVIKSMIGGCPLTTTYDFTVPAYAPSGTALLAWTWQNLIGNREFYMNCAEVNVIGASSKKKLRRRQSSTFGQLPYLWKANLAGLNNCATVENVTVVYPEPGPAVQYGDGASSSSPATPGKCDAGTPYGQTYKNLGDTSPPPASLSNKTVTTITLGAVGSSAPTAVMAMTPRRQNLATTEQHSTTTITVDCPQTVTLQTMPPYYITAAACTGTSASCPCKAGYGCSELSPCIWGCEAFPTNPPPNPKSSFKQSHTTKFITTTHIVVPVKPTKSVHKAPPPKHKSPPPAKSNPGQPSYVGSNANKYLPCVPGTFICVDSTTWDTCDYNVEAQWVYEYPRPVAAGMKCQPSLSRYGSGSTRYGQQRMTPKGYYRDDQIVRA